MIQAQIRRFRAWLSVGVLLLPLLIYSIPHFLRPPLQPETRSLFEGITYERQIRSTPYPALIHIVTIELTAPGIDVLATPGSVGTNHEFHARTTSEFLTEFHLQLAVNANFFFPFREHTPVDFYPQSGDRVSVVGQAISQGRVYSTGEANWTVLCFAADHRAQILARGECPAGTQHAVAGRELLIQQGQPVAETQKASDGDKPYARMVAAIDRRGETLWLIAVDGKMPLYSHGLTIAEVTQLVMQLGADTAVNLDGGGSATLVMATSQGARLLNAPAHTKIPMRERPVANHLGVYARSLIR